MSRIKILLIFSIIASLTNNCFADDVTYINKDDKAPYSGFLFTETKTKEIRLQLIDLDTYKSLNSSLTRTVELYKKNEEIDQTKINTLLDQNDKLADSLYSARETSNWEKGLWFFGGAILTGLAFYGASQVYK